MEGIADVSAAVSSATAVTALILVWLQLRTQSKQLRQAALIGLHEELLQPEIQRAIRSIYQLDPADLREPSSELLLEQIELVLNRYDLIGNRIQFGVIPERQTLLTEWPVVLRLEHQLREFIEMECQLRGGAPYKEGFRWLVKKSEQYRKTHALSVSSAPFRRNYGSGDWRQGASDAVQ